ncbi:MAG: glycosyltransferase family 4 protein [Gemmatimonadota bacterium]
MAEAAGRGLRVLVTNRTLATRTGTELYVRDLAFALAERGHTPVVYTPQPGDVAREIRARTIAVTDDLRTVAEPPDVIHGHHGLETLSALLAFPGVPAVALCHSWIGWADAPVPFPRVLRYVAVDDTCRDRLRFEHGIPDERIRVVLNSVDLSRFRPRPPLPARPGRALVFSNAAAPGQAQLPAIQEACAAAGIQVDVVGASAGRSTASPEEALHGYDLVFAKARAALEAMSVGAAVVLCDAVGAGPMVTTANFDRLRRVNFGMRALGQPVTPEFLAGEIARYDAADAAAVSRAVRESAGTDAMVDELCELYGEAVAEHAAAGPDDLREEQRAAAAYLQALSPRLLQRDLLAGALQGLLRRPLLGRVARHAAAASRKSWIAGLVRMEGLD